MPLLSDAQVIDSVRRRCRRSADAVHGEMKRGLHGLATIASTAPFVGLFGTLLGIVNSFPGCSGEKSACMAAVMERLSESLVPTELALLVALPALLSYRYLRSELEAIDVEMENASLDLMNRLALHRRKQRTAT